jgi:hypothetical protein
VLAAEHLLVLGGLDLGLQLGEASLEVIVDGLVLLEPFADDHEVGRGGLQARREIDVLPEAPAALEDLLGLCLVAPEVRRADALLEAGDFLFGTSGLKDNSAGRRPAS